MKKNRKKGKKTKELQKQTNKNSQKAISKMMIVDPYLSIITLIVNSLNCLIKRQSH